MDAIRVILRGIIVLAVIVGVFYIVRNAAAKGSSAPLPLSSPLHPTFALLDADGEPVLENMNPVSTMETCGACHDTTFIESHSFHVSVGLDDYDAPGESGNRPWDTSPGWFGSWNPIVYRYLSPASDELLDLGTAEWIQVYGLRHVGGGPAIVSPSGDRLDQLPAMAGDPRTHVLDPETGEPAPWDWKQSGVVEMNCFLCHTPLPNNPARIDALHAGDFRWANTATLLGTGIVEQVEGEYRWLETAFNEDGELLPEFVQIQDPSNINCGQCHGLVHANIEEPLSMAGCSPERIRTVTTGQIISPQRILDSGMNLADKETLSRTWDIHAERLLGCTDCHYSLNNPVYYQESEDSRPEHLLFDPRRLDLGEYLLQPLHQFARGQSAQTNVSPDLTHTMRRCESCHDAIGTHDWLPYTERHIDTLSCETCHIPNLYSNTMMQNDWTVLKPDGNSSTACRGLEGEGAPINLLVTGYEPIWLMQSDVDEKLRVAPFNLVTSWYWVYSDPPRPVRLIDLQAAWLDEGNYVPDVIDLFDANTDGQLDSEELRIDSEQKERLIAGRLEDLGLDNPRIVGEVQPYSINHSVTSAEWALNDCQTCHSDDSRMVQSFQLANYLPGGVQPEFIPSSNTVFEGELYTNDQGQLFYRSSTEQQGLYVFGLDNVHWIDRLGAFTFVAVLLGISLHGGLRVYSTYRNKPEKASTHRMYMYGVYERLWHWLQTFAIVALLFTGLIIHSPETFGLFSFRYVVLVHNILAVVLVINAGLSLFYHLASGEIRQFIPRPAGFFDQAIVQAKFYLRGIFRNEEHPFEKSPGKKLNPLQQLTYFGILNVFLPLQIITGILMWGVQRWSDLASSLGGLPFLAPFHSLIAWLFGAFIVLHVYLTTTGPEPLTSMRAMVSGWDEIEVSPSNEEAS
jgi:thiosulfate reductase cytochrome b subunit